MVETAKKNCGRTHCGIWKRHIGLCMPESVLMWTEARDVNAMQSALSDIISAYERDFAKHPDVTEFPKISMIWKSIPSQLARENNSGW